MFKETLTIVQEQLMKDANEETIKYWNRLKSIVLARELAFEESKVAAIEPGVMMLL